MVATMRALFPAADVEVTRTRRPAQHDFRFFPTMRWSHLVLPAHPAGAAARTTWRFSVADGVASSAARVAAAAALATVGPRSRDRILVDGATDSILDHLAAVLGRPVTASIGIGTARANRKPVLEVFDVRGRTLGFAKVGIDATSRKHVRGEADRLARVSGHVPPGMALPEVLDASTWRGNEVLVMSAFATRPQRPGIRSRVPTDLMYAFSREFGSRTVALVETPFWRRQLEILGSLAPGELRDRLERVAMRLGEIRGEVLVEAGAWHGDWTPWNMAWRGGELQVWDLERFAPDGLVGLDVAHYVVNERMQQHGVSIGTVLEACALAARTVPPPVERGEVVASGYLLAVALRYLASVPDDHGSLAHQRAELMTAAAERFVDAPRRG